MTARLAEQICELTTASFWMWSPQTGLMASDELQAGIDAAAAAPTPLPLVDSLVHPADRPIVRQAIHDGLRSPAGFDITHRCLDSGGAVRTVRSRGRGRVDADGVLTAACGSVQDITHTAAMASEVWRARDLFGAELDIAAERSIIGLDLQGRVTLFDSGAQRMLGYPAEEMLGAPVPPGVHDPSEVQARADELGIEFGFRAIIGSAVNGDPETRQWTYVTKTGRRLQVRVTVSAVYDHTGRINGYIKSGVDVTARMAGRRARDASEALFEELFDQAPGGIMLTDASQPGKARILRANPALCRITGYTEQQLLTMSVADLTHHEQQGLSEQLLHRLNDGRSLSEETERRWIHADGRDIWVQLIVTTVRNTDSHLTLAVVEDITTRRDTTRQLEHTATHDHLTGLPNRYLLTDRLDDALRFPAHSAGVAGVLFIDLDGFKTVNDTLGHDAGDQVLRVAAARLKRHLRSADLVARVGGDEFVVLCPNLTGATEAIGLAHRLLDELRRPYRTPAGTTDLSGSIGVALSVPGDTGNTLLTRADAAMYVAKHAGKNQTHLHQNRDLFVPAARQVTRLKDYSSGHAAH